VQVHVPRCQKVFEFMNNFAMLYILYTTQNHSGINKFICLYILNCKCCMLYSHYIKVAKMKNRKWLKMIGQKCL
jgi:hypothetical protein